MHAECAILCRCLQPIIVTRNEQVSGSRLFAGSLVSSRSWTRDASASLPDRLPAGLHRPPGSVSRRLLENRIGRIMLRPGSGCSRFGQGEEAEEARDCRLVAFDLDVTGAQRLGELAALVDQRDQRGGVGLDDRVWP